MNNFKSKFPILFFQIDQTKGHFGTILIVAAAYLVFSGINNLNDLVRIILMFVLFIDSIRFSKNSDYGASLTAGSGKFSWKFFEGIPKTKEDLCLELFFMTFYRYCPLLLTIIVTSADLNKAFEWELSLLTFNYFAFIIIVLISTHYPGSFLKTPRMQHSAPVSKENQKYKSIITILGGANVFAFLCYGVLFLVQYPDSALVGALKQIFKIIDWFFNAWAFPLSLFALASYKLFQMPKLWEDEKRGYRDPNINHKRYAIINGLFFFIFCMPLFHFYKNPHIIVTAKDMTTKLHSLLWHDDIEGIEKYLKDNPDALTTPNENGLFPIHVAVYRSNLKTVKFLESKGSSLIIRTVPKEKEDKPHSPIDLAMKRRKREKFQYLYEKGLRPTKELENFNPILHYSKLCKPKFLQWLIEEKYDFNAQDSKGVSALMNSAKNKCLGNIIVLQKYGADFGLKDKESKTIVDYAKKSRKGTWKKQYIWLIDWIAGDS